MIWPDGDLTLEGPGSWWEEVPETWHVHVDWWGLIAMECLMGIRAESIKTVPRRTI